MMIGLIPARLAARAIDLIVEMARLGLVGFERCGDEAGIGITLRHLPISVYLRISIALTVTANARDVIRSKAVLRDGAIIRC